MKHSHLCVAYLKMYWITGIKCTKIYSQQESSLWVYNKYFQQKGKDKYTALIAWDYLVRLFLNFSIGTEVWRTFTDKG